MAAASIITSVITGGSNSHQSVAEEFNAYATDFVNQGVLGTITLGAGSTAGTGGFAVSQDASPDMGVTIASGVAYVAGTPSGQAAQVVRARMTSNYTIYTINANSSGSTKYDWIYLSFSATNASTPSSSADNVVTLVTSRSSSNSSDNGTPPTYGILLAVVTVANGASSITNSNISDRRTQASLSSVNTGGSTGWASLGYALTYSANNGAKEFTVTTPNDLRGTISAGMKLSVARSTTPPTQAMSFTAASSQYATKSSPSGITFTSAFTIEGWLYPTSYPAIGSAAMLCSRLDNTAANGFYTQLHSSGQIVLAYASAGTNTTWATYGSIQLNQWNHIACVVTSVASKTAAIYINGISQPLSSLSSGATALTQAGNLTLGRWDNGTQYYDGYLSEVRIWSAAQSQANIRANMAISLTGSETNLVALYKGDNAWTDATANANTLTATNGATFATANPYNATEYAVVTNVSYSAPTTTLTLFTGTTCNIPNQTLNSPYYSTTRAPYGFPAGTNDWVTEVISRRQIAVSSNATYQLMDGGNTALYVPTGKWVLDFGSDLYTTTTTTVFFSITNNTAITGVSTTSGGQAMGALAFRIRSSTGEDDDYMKLSAPITCTSPQTYKIYTIGSTTGVGFDGLSAPTIFRATCAYI